MQYVNNLEQRLNAKVDIMRDRLEREKRKLRLLKVQVPVAKAIDKN